MPISPWTAVVVTLFAAEKLAPRFVLLAIQMPLGFQNNAETTPVGLTTSLRVRCESANELPVHALAPQITSTCTAALKGVDIRNCACAGTPILPNGITDMPAMSKTNSVINFIP
jgi:hypothetical protein